MGEQENLNEIHNLETKVNEIENRLNDLLKMGKVSDQEHEELKEMALWSTAVNKHFEVKICQMMAEEQEILSEETIQKANLLAVAQKEYSNVVAECQKYEEKMQKRTKWLNRHMMSMDDILTDCGSCACATFKECPTNERKMKKIKNLIDELSKIGGICLTMSVMQMWGNNSKGQQNSCIGLIIGGVILLAFHCLLIVQPNEPSVKLKHLEKISRYLLFVVYCVGLFVIGYISFFN